MFFFRNAKLVRTVIVLITALQLNALAMGAWASGVLNSAAAAQDLGREVISGFSHDAAALTLGDVFPDLGVKATELEDVFGEDTETLELGVESQNRLMFEPSEEGEAFRLVNQSARRLSPDLSSDPMFNVADSVRSNEYMTAFMQEFSDCSRKDVFEDVEKSVHMPKYETCERINKYSGQSEISHDYSIGIIEYLSGQPNYQSCGKGCLHVWVGTVGDDYWGGNCTVYEQNTAFRVINREAITSVTLEQAVFDDYFQVYLNNKKVWTHTPGVFPPETPGACERNTSWNVSPGRNITQDFLQAGDTIIFKTRTSVTGAGEGYARIRINFDPAKAFVSNGWGPEEAQKTLNMINDGFCPDHTAQCTRMPGVDSSGCLTVSGVTVCESDVDLLQINGISPFCQEASLDASCNFNEGAMDCWTDVNGNQQCPVNGGDTCSINHTLVIEEVARITGSFAGNGRDIATGELDFLAGTWRQIAPSDGTAWSGSVPKANYDDFCSEDGPIDNTRNAFWPEYGLGGKLDTSATLSVITPPSCNNGLKAVVQIRDTRSASDTKYALSGSFTFAKLAVKRDTWSPESCIRQAQTVLNGQCETGSIQVMKGAAYEGQCATISGITICPGSELYGLIQPSPVGTSRLAEQVRVNGCGMGDSGQDTCTALEENPECGFISQKCIEGASGETGTCYAYSEVWDCGYEASYSTVVNTGSKIECPGGVACMGTECFDDSNTKSGDFAYAVAMLQVAQFAEHDMECGGDPEDITQDNTCKIFPGQAMECKKALGGYVDCCEAPSGVNLFDYVNLTMNGLKMASSIEALSREGSLFAPGYWEGAKAAIGGIGESVMSGNWGGMMDAASAAYKEGFAGAAEGIVSQFQSYLMEQAYDAMVNMGAEAAANAVFQPTSTGGMGLSSQAAAVVNVVGFIYTAYVIADLMINIIWECEQKEFELGAKKETRQCVYVGSYCASKALGSCVEKREAYCCYSSVVARIIQEQGKPQLGYGFGSAKSPSCDALSVDDLARINWNAIDLTEWIGMLSMTDNLPTINTVSLDHLTGSGSGLGNVFEDDERLNSYDRNVQRLDGIDVDDIKRQAEIGAAGKVR